LPQGNEAAITSLVACLEDEAFEVLALLVQKYKYWREAAITSLVACLEDEAFEVLALLVQSTKVQILARTRHLRRACVRSATSGRLLY
jgi:hypothetical protein